MQRLFSLFLLLILCGACFAADSPEVHYLITLQDPLQHKLHVQMSFPRSPGGDLQLPVWNATYQIRDFAQYVSNVRSGGVLLKKTNTSRWHLDPGADGWTTVDYDYIADMPGPFGASYDSSHAFLNFAMLLLYPVEQRATQVRVEIQNVPAGWRMATPLPAIGGVEAGRARFALHARNYDHLVDSPVEIGRLTEFTFPLAEANIRVAIDGDPADFDREKIKTSLQKITTAATDWMKDVPFSEYTFIFHFPHGPARGGMEHSYAAAIDMNADRLKSDYSAFESVSAHEFFHLWNVKRIRPRSLEPVDFTREQPTTALWFSEGVTSTVGNYIQLRAGSEDKARFIKHVEEAITTLQSRPAHLWQSAEQSSVETWFDKYESYRLPDRSISYYNKGEILGYLLDLRLREVTQGKKSLRDIFLYLNEHFAQQHKSFADSAGIEQAVEAVSGTSFEDFFSLYVAGTKELPYNEFFRTVGMKVVRTTSTTLDPGFEAVHNFSGPLIVIRSENPEIRVGDVILKIDGKALSNDLEAELSQHLPGSQIHLKLRAGDGSLRGVAVRLLGKTEPGYRLEQFPNLTQQQKTLQRQWLSGDKCPADCSESSR